MKIRWDPGFAKVTAAVVDILKTDHPDITESEVGAMLTQPPDFSLGDLALGVFRWAPVLKKSPPQVAQVLAEKLEAKGYQARAVGPYVNVTLSVRDHWEWWQSLASGAAWQQPWLEEAPRTMVEFSQPNTHKELHVGHLRNACLGDSLVRIKRFCGVPVISSTFPGDLGMHVAKCLWYFKNVNPDPVPETHRGQWLGRLYAKATRWLEEHEGTPEGEKAWSQIREILKELESQQGPYYELWKDTREWSIQEMKQIYQWLDVNFDVWFWESEVDQPSRQYVWDLYEKGVLVKSEGAIGMDLREENLGFAILLKSDGSGLYLTKDLELARRKFQDFQIERNVYVVDVRQSFHFAQLFKILEKLGFPYAHQCYHLSYNYVELPDGPISSRRGHVVGVDQVMREMMARIHSEYLSKYRLEMPSEQRDEIARKVAVGALRYGMVRLDHQTKLVFDMNEWLRLDGNSGPFIQYAGARIHSLLRKSGSRLESLLNSWSRDLEGEPLWEDLAARRLMGWLWHFGRVVRIAAVQEKPHLLAQYVYEVAKAFHSFYAAQPILNEPKTTLKEARLRLSAATLVVLRLGMGLLGIPELEKM